jgi:uncharacterized protein YggU (UPF0235/DUF167 family)
MGKLNCSREEGPGVKKLRIRAGVPKKAALVGMPVPGWFIFYNLGSGNWEVEAAPNPNTASREELQKVMEDFKEFGYNDNIKRHGHSRTFYVEITPEMVQDWASEGVESWEDDMVTDAIQGLPNTDIRRILKQKGSKKASELRIVSGKKDQPKKRETFEEAVERGYKESKEVFEKLQKKPVLVSDGSTTSDLGSQQS